MSLPDITQAMNSKDYRTATKLIQQLGSGERRNPLIQLYMAQIYEASHKLAKAQALYRQLLQDPSNPKVMNQARQGLKRLENWEANQRQEAIAQAKADPGGTDVGLLILEGLDPAGSPTEKQTQRQLAAQKFAKIMQLDAYSARLQLPNTGWRLYRTGAVGEMNFYRQQLEAVGLPSFAAAAGDINQINVFTGHYLQSDNPPTVICANAEGQVGSLSFQWSEVSQQVVGLLPWFEEVYSMDVRRQMQHKTETLDYIQVCDLHLPGRNSMIRLCDRHYQFAEGVFFSPQQGSKQTTVRTNWNNLLAFVNQHLPGKPQWSDFTTFGETAVDFGEFLKRIPPHIHLARPEDTPWDAAFQLYSGLVFQKYIKTTPMALNK